MSDTYHVIAWNTRDRRLIKKVCSYLGVDLYMSVNRTTSVGVLTDEQLRSLDPLVSGKYIQIRTHRKKTKFYNKLM